MNPHIINSNLSLDSSMDTAIAFLGMSYRYRIAWKVPVEKIHVPAKEFEYDTLAAYPFWSECFLVRSSTHSIRSIKNLMFCLELYLESQIRCKENQRYCIRIIYNPDSERVVADTVNAFVMLGGRVFSLKRLEKSDSDKFLPLTTSVLREIIEEDPDKLQTITIHSAIYINGKVRELGLADNYTLNSDEIVYEWENAIDAQMQIENTQLTEFLFSGTMPNLSTIEKAKEWIIEADEKGLYEYKAIGMEFLKQKLCPENAIEILEIACKHDMKYLQAACFRYLRNKCDIKKKVIL